jgi:ketosteroid isomerase-like protein
MNDMTNETASLAELTRTVAALSAEVTILRAEAEIRRVQARYMFLCDTPCPEAGVDDDAERIRRIVDLYTEDAVWEGVGAYYDGQFGRSTGKDAIRRHFEGFWGRRRDPALILNVHYLTTEHITVEGDEALGHWVHIQPWIFSDGSSLLRSSRLWNRFRKVDGQWKIARTRTENVYVAPLAPGWAESVGATSVLMRREDAR